MNSILLIHQQYQDYSFTFKGLSKQTLKKEFYVFKAFANHTNIHNPNQVNRALVERYITEKKINNHWSAKTIKNCLQALNNFFKFCLDQQYISENPVENIPKPKAPKRLPNYIPKDDAIKLIEWTYVAKFRYKFERIRARAIIATFLFTGIRQAELLNLKISDIHFLESSLKVVHGKGGKDRIIPINPRLKEILKEYIHQREIKEKSSIYFFTSLKYDQKMSQSVLKRLFTRLQKDMGFRVYPHLLRHTFATLMLQGHCDLFTLSNMMGHSDIKTTTIYLSLSTNHLNQQIHKHPLSFTVMQHDKMIF
ncbi:tyrosine-type recombinase/integrase [Tenacibaculum xiamenense]|uniref:tyrosine-type recombinase/integrase n=1 Tax=Tenacibaculum xiamenense TaxID=1261553 RepID=UPI003893C9C1